MSLNIRCDRDGCDCEQPTTVLGKKPDGWTVVHLGFRGNDGRRDYCPYHTPQLEPLPEKTNGYPCVAKCVNCGDYLTLWPDNRERLWLAHPNRLETQCYMGTVFASADRPVPELGLLDQSNQGRV